MRLVSGMAVTVVTLRSEFTKTGQLAEQTPRSRRRTEHGFSLAAGFAILSLPTLTLTWLENVALKAILCDCESV
jgi:hypothetical protein